MDRLQAMKMFVAVVEAGGFSAAARKLDISTSVVSRVIGELEGHLGTILLNRTTRTLRLTEIGVSYFEGCRRILGEVDDVEMLAAGMHSVPRGDLHITASVLLGTTRIMPLVVEFLERFPQVNISCWYLDRMVNMIDEGIDVGVRIGTLPDSSLQAIHVGKVRRVLCASPAYLEKAGMPSSPDDLPRHRTILANGISASAEWHFSKASHAKGPDGGRHVQSLLPRLRTTTNDSAISAAVAGFGITQLLSYQVAEHLREGTLKVVLADYELEPLPISVIHLEGRQARAKVRAFLDFIVDRLRADKTLN
jgi:DNA-binding transcriptional LysR family regulator